MAVPPLPTIDFSPAKSQLSDVMTQVFHGHQPRIVSRHHGKEQMLLVRPDDLVTMLGEHRLDVQAVYDQDEVTLRVPDMGVLGFGQTLDEAVEDLLVELRAYATRFFHEPVRFLATSRGAHAAALLRFALVSEDEQRRMLGVEEPEREAEFWEVLRTRTPAHRASAEPEPAPKSLPLWLAQALELEVGLTRDRIKELDEIEARRQLDEVRSRPKA